MASSAYPAMAAHNLELDDLFSGTFQSVMRIEERALDNRYTQGLTITDIHTIVAVGLYERNPMNVCATRLDVTLATLTTAVNKLEKLGYVRRERSQEDRRKVLLSLTTQGRKAYRAHLLFHKRMISEALNGLTNEEQRVLAHALAKVKGFFDARA
ncbi:MarR family transcriptional regulator [Denitrobacterium detoxificans]|mgnify:FL=1|uniref:HTH-type transcriptional regulator SarZ n=1 Tax=Denitrobacterium detoxificans TaxID=79604 RepID=A0A172RWN0_9ACTN|nr:MarR family transcriptional regulator [Denitrobacterium detoxificans]ANE22132.1 MarR family transcriptional regulator [Denitrobacterium detoxificans]MBE6465717.1 MarR family transcriptional regulator [Denitrobacterium detoxificans]SEO84709.1 transcriptional regulator, MarR family [Denitrobacterium detoxificans]